MAVQLSYNIRTNSNTHDEDDTVEGAKAKFAAMQASMDAAVADADSKRAE